MLLVAANTRSEFSVKAAHMVRVHRSEEESPIRKVWRTVCATSLHFSPSGLWILSPLRTVSNQTSRIPYILSAVECVSYG
jgi:hypothetical protein